MPQPVDTKQTGTITLLFTFAKYPEHALGIAGVFNAWAHLEDELIFFLQQFMWWRHGTSNGVARAAWFSVESLAARMNMIRAISGPYLSDDRKAEWREIETELHKRAKERHRIAHGCWWSSERLPGRLILRDGSSSPMLTYTVKDFDEIVARIRGTLARIDRFWNSAKGEATEKMIEDSKKDLAFRQHQLALRAEGKSWMQLKVEVVQDSGEGETTDTLGK